VSRSDTPDSTSSINIHSSSPNHRNKLVEQLQAFPQKIDASSQFYRAPSTSVPNTTGLQDNLQMQQPTSMPQMDQQKIPVQVQAQAQLGTMMQAQVQNSLQQQQQPYAPSGYSNFQAASNLASMPLQTQFNQNLTQTPTTVSPSPYTGSSITQYPGSTPLSQVPQHGQQSTQIDVQSQQQQNFMQHQQFLQMQAYQQQQANSNPYAKSPGQTMTRYPATYPQQPTH
jgi:hypothetical protein